MPKKFEIASDDEDSDDDLQFDLDDAEDDDDDQPFLDDDDDDDDEIDLAVTKAKPARSRGGSRRTVAKVDVDDDEESDDDEIEENPEIAELRREVAKYDPATMYMGPADEAKLAAMTEMEREMELFERSEKYDEMKDKLDRMVKIHEAKLEKAGKKKKRSRGGAEKSQPNKKARSRLDEAFEDDDDEEEPEFFDDDYFDSYSSSHKDSKKKREAVSEDPDAWRIPMLEVPEYEDILQIQLKRDHIMKWINEMHFEDTVKGLLVRVNKGVQSTAVGRVAPYRMAEVVGIKEGEKYMIGKVVTNRHLVVDMISLSDRSNTTQLYEAKFVSNKIFTEKEFKDYCYRLDKIKQNLPRKSYIKEKSAFEKQADSFVYDNDALERKLVFQKRLTEDKVTISTRTKTELSELIKVAQDTGDVESFEKYSSMKNEMDEKERQVAMNRQTKEAHIAKINAANRRRNLFTDVEETTESKQAAGGFDPFARVRTVSSLGMKIKQKDEKKDEVKDEVKKEESPLSANGVMFRAAKKRMQLLNTAKSIREAHTLDFDIDLDDDDTAQKPSPVPKAKTAYTAPSHSATAGENSGGVKKISLGEYFKRRNQ